MGDAADDLYERELQDGFLADYPEYRTFIKGEDMSEREDTKITQTGVWKKVGKKSGKPYLSGALQNYWVNIFRNSDPERTDNDPVAHLKLSPREYPAEDNEYNTHKFEFPKGTIINLYKRTSKKGRDYLRGIRDNLQYHLYEVDKKSPKAPDYNLVIYRKSSADYTKESNPKKEPVTDGGIPPERDERAKAKEALETLKEQDAAEEEEFGGVNL